MRLVQISSHTSSSSWIMDMKMDHIFLSAHFATRINTQLSFTLSSSLLGGVESTLMVILPSNEFCKPFVPFCIGEIVMRGYQASVGA